MLNSLMAAPEPLDTESTHHINSATLHSKFFFGPYNSRRFKIYFCVEKCYCYLDNWL